MPVDPTALERFMAWGDFFTPEDSGDGYTTFWESLRAAREEIERLRAEFASAKEAYELESGTFAGDLADLRTQLAQRDPDAKPLGFESLEANFCVVLVEPPGGSLCKEYWRVSAGELYRGGERVAELTAEGGSIHEAIAAVQEIIDAVPDGEERG